MEADGRQGAQARGRRQGPRRRARGGDRKLENDFYAWDDGQYRDRVIKPAWDHAKSELTDAKNELVAAEKDLADLPEKARQAGAMPGWIRE